MQYFVSTSTTQSNSQSFMLLHGTGSWLSLDHPNDLGAT